MRPGLNRVSYLGDLDSTPKLTAQKLQPFKRVLLNKIMRNFSPSLITPRNSIKHQLQGPTKGIELIALDDVRSVVCRAPNGC